MNIGVYPGSFDPITIGHLDIIEKALEICDEVHVIVAKNFSKKHMFSLEERTEIVKESVRDISIPEGKKILIVQYEGIISSYAKKVKANIMIRGIRSHIDLAYEQNMEQFTKATAPNMVTVYFTAEASHMFTSSTLVRQFIQTGNIDTLSSYLSSRGFVKINDFIQIDREKYVQSFAEESIIALQLN
jgi:pantetheine-phosphate adenylyltransferase